MARLDSRARTTARNLLEFRASFLTPVEGREMVTLIHDLLPAHARPAWSGLASEFMRSFGSGVLSEDAVFRSVDRMVDALNTSLNREEVLELAGKLTGSLERLRATGAK